LKVQRCARSVPFPDRNGEIETTNEFTLKCKYKEIDMAIKKSDETKNKEAATLTETTTVETANMSGLRTGKCKFENGVHVNARLQKASVIPTKDIALWAVIRKSTEAISFKNYKPFMDAVLCCRDERVETYAGLPADSDRGALYKKLRKRRFLPFNDTDAYRVLKVATEAFLLVNSGVKIAEFDFTDTADALNLSLDTNFTDSDIEEFFDKYLGEVNGDPDRMLPYEAILYNKLKNEGIVCDSLSEQAAAMQAMAVASEKCLGVLGKKRFSPFLFELIWSYWQEEGMLVQTMNAIARRFQNMRSSGGERDPLANLEIDTLRPLSNLLWGYVQDEQHRLSIVRRAYEYDHHYGISIQGKAVRRLRTADSRSNFIEAFHQLLQLASIFFKQDDDTTVHADGFPLLNAIKEVHLVLSQGAHNQFGDLPSTARQEMLIQQWILARPEFREFLPTRNAVAYPEPWMDRVEAMKSLQGWTDTSIIHFHNLAIFGEQILLSIRYGAWSEVTQPAQAANWARIWRAEMQGYTHAYRAVTGVDLSSITADRVDSTPPSVHLYNRYAAQARRY
jgi:hypothetical protein